MAGLTDGWENIYRRITGTTAQEQQISQATNSWWRNVATTTTNNTAVSTALTQDTLNELYTNVFRNFRSELIDQLYIQNPAAYFLNPEHLVVRPQPAQRLGVEELKEDFAWLG